MDTEKRIYEFSYLLVPTVTEEEVQSKIDALKKLFTENGAEVIAEENPEYIGLAYTMIHKVNNKNVPINSAYFGWFKVSVDPQVLDEIKAILDRDLEVLRYMIIKTVAENTLAPKKLSQKRDVQKRTSRTNDTAETASTDEEVKAETEETEELLDEEPQDTDEETVAEEVAETVEE